MIQEKQFTFKGLSLVTRSLAGEDARKLLKTDFSHPDLKFSNSPVDLEFHSPSPATQFLEQHFAISKAIFQLDVARVEQFKPGAIFEVTYLKQGENVLPVAFSRSLLKQMQTGMFEFTPARYLDRIGVFPKTFNNIQIRGTGLGRELIEHLEQLILKQGEKYLHLETTSGARPFYEHLGFKLLREGSRTYFKHIALLLLPILTAMTELRNFKKTSADTFSAE